MPEAAKGERIAKVIARAGLCSRRQAERLIAEGRVALGGRILTTAAVNVSPDAPITVDGRALPRPARTRLWRYHKPRGVITTTRDPEGRPTLFDRLPPGLPRLQTVGRLDFNSEGLILLTNDGGLKRRLELPSAGWERCYRVRVRGRVEEAALAELAHGVTIDGVTYGPVDARLERQGTSNAWLTMTLTEGKNREVRRLCEHLGLQVNRLIRTSYGPFKLASLRPGELEELPARVLKEELGLGEEPATAVAKGARKAKCRARPSGPKAPSGQRGGKKNAHRRRTP